MRHHRVDSADRQVIECQRNSARLHWRACYRSHPLDAFDLKTLVRALVVPPMPLLVLALLGLTLLSRQPRLGKRLMAVSVFFLWLGSIGVTADLLAWLLEKDQTPLTADRLQAARNGPHPPAAIVVLGGGAVRDGAFTPQRERLHERTIERVIAGARLARDSGLPVLVSGGRPKWLQNAEAFHMQALLQGDLKQPVRWVEDRSRDTAENAEYSAKLLRQDGIDSIVLVTQAYHMPRSQRSFEAVGLHVLPAPHGFKSSPPWLTEWSDWLPSVAAMETVWLSSHELIGSLWYRLRGLT